MNEPDHRANRSLSMPIRTLIIDDEPLARERIKGLLTHEVDFEVVGLCGNGREALSLIQEVNPDLLFLDVQMPELDGLSLVSQLDPEHLPEIIFVTAYDQYALKAFEIHALDYLLKPFDKARFQRTLTRSREQVARARQGGINEQLMGLLRDLHVEKKPIDRLVIRTDGKVLLLRPEEIDWIESAGNYVKVHVGKEEHLHREALGSVEARLRPDLFLRIHRSTLVNVECIRELEPFFQGEYLVILRDGTRLNLSRHYKERAMKILGL